MGNNWRNYLKNWVSVLGLVILLLLLITALIGPVLAPFDPDDLEIGRRATPPGTTFWVGTDELGRDVFSRAVTAIRVSLLVGVIAAAVSTVVGVLVGSLAGFFGGWLDHVLMRITEVFQVVPMFFLAVVLVALFGASVLNIIISIALLTWPIIF